MQSDSTDTKKKKPAAEPANQVVAYCNCMTVNSSHSESQHVVKLNPNLNTGVVEKIKQWGWDLNNEIYIVEFEAYGCYIMEVLGAMKLHILEAREHIINDFHVVSYNAVKKCKSDCFIRVIDCPIRVFWSLLTIIVQ